MTADDRRAVIALNFIGLLVSFPRLRCATTSNGIA
jgi:hypothetical protein